MTWHEEQTETMFSLSQGKKIQISSPKKKINPWKHRPFTDVSFEIFKILHQFHAKRQWKETQLGMDTTFTTAKSRLAHLAKPVRLLNFEELSKLEHKAKHQARCSISAFSYWCRLGNYDKPVYFLTSVKARLFHWKAMKVSKMKLAAPGKLMLLKLISFLIHYAVTLASHVFNRGL